MTLMHVMRGRFGMTLPGHCYGRDGIGFSMMGMGMGLGINVGMDIRACYGCATLSGGSRRDGSGKRK